MYLYIPNYYKVKGKFKYINYNNWKEQFEELKDSLKKKDEEGALGFLQEIFGSSSLIQDIIQVEKPLNITEEEFKRKLLRIELQKFKELLLN